jgi:hypothetical protein
MDAVESKNREYERSRDKDMDKEKYSLEFEPEPYKGFKTNTTQDSGALRPSHAHNSNNKPT